MVKNFLTIGIILLFIVVMIHPVIAVEFPIKPVRDGNFLYVGGSEEGNYTTIHDAIDNASDGDTVFVYSGTYYENVVIDNSINLIGKRKESTIIDGGGTGSVIQIMVDSVTVSEFTIQNSGIDKIDDAGILLKWSPVNDVEISNNIITNNYEGIVLHGMNNTVHNNTIKRNKASGIFVRNSNNIIDSNNILFHNCGIFVGVSDYNILSNNDIKFSWWGILIGGSNNNKIFRNNISLSRNSGITLGYGASDNNIYLNNFLRNTAGLSTIDIQHGGGAYGNNIYLNNFIYNWFGVRIDPTSRSNLLYHNNFIKNRRNALDWYQDGNYWDDGSDGNYWDNYRGKDNDGNGIGDTPKRIFPYFIENKDSYPLMEPFEDVPEVTINLVNTLVQNRASSYLWYEWLERFPMLERLLSLIK